ncbi:hypothetical protein POJ06DRAFT_125885 [Lipomyces tetrasporus]|uniref:Secreted protein n=1 Tax=Lipomyces tetrasporus TaxID=54092 RepID=A0AAD7QQ97_9ASCO|nr:uncharacterized protein POJ06DRAFT_125885 [Lipomyces tetrasporus]KAJ8098991.1 hypothetical protein POJ06DRAFT_125885 [Lipomyces tetrasporus]
MRLIRHFFSLIVMSHFVMLLSFSISSCPLSQVTSALPYLAPRCHTSFVSYSNICVCSGSVTYLSSWLCLWQLCPTVYDLGRQAEAVEAGVFILCMSRGRIWVISCFVHLVANTI